MNTDGGGDRFLGLAHEFCRHYNSLVGDPKSEFVSTECQCILWRFTSRTWLRLMVRSKNMNDAAADQVCGAIPCAEADILSCLEEVQRTFSQSVSRTERSAIGQFLTPAPIARFMAGLFERHVPVARILDPGAGTGSLFAALVEHMISQPERPEAIEVVAYEIDRNILPHLEVTVALCRKLCAATGIVFQGTIRGEDFISAAVSGFHDGLFAVTPDDFTHVILNPPYKKINGETWTRRILNAAGMEVSNLYAAFVWLAACLTRPGGEIVAITPRSFCNGPYFRRFRKALLSLLDLRHIHTFESRREAFADDAVLQENVIFHGIRNTRQNGTVTISTSKGPVFSEVQGRSVPFQEIVVPDDSDAFIHLVESDNGREIAECMSRFNSTLGELGLEVSTGRVVDFRAREFLRRDPERATVPLIYPCHFENGFVRWPLPGAKKPNAIVSSAQTEGLLVPAGYYVLTKRFTAKEERRRIVGAIYDPTRIDAPLVGFENHLNYFHAKGQGLSADLARGLAVFLNSSLLDGFFRLFSGHTQVNATDLRKVRYPSRRQMLQLGRAMESVPMDQQTIDAALEKVWGKDE
jgi:adenine-specific DNA-methyltransferase